MGSPCRATMKLLLCFAVTVLGTEHLVRREVIFRKKRGAGKSKKQEVVGNDGIARWSPPPPPTLPTPQWWNARWTCNLRCAKFHTPRSGSYHATCKLDSST